MRPIEWVFIGIAAVAFLSIVFFRPSRRHWPILVFIGLVALVGLLLASMNVDPQTCLRIGLDCL